MLLNVCRVAARRSVAVSARSALVRVPPRSLRSFTTTPRRFEAASSSVVNNGAVFTTAPTTSATSAVPPEVAASDWVASNSLFDGPYLPHNNQTFSDYLGGHVDIDQLLQQSPDAASSVTASTSAAPGVSAEELELSQLADGLSSDLITAAGGTPTLADLGLGGWTPWGILQSVLCGVESWGLPWWATIVATTLTFRVVLFPVAMRIQKYGIQMNNVLPEMQKIQAEIERAREEGSHMDHMRASTDLAMFMSEKKLNPMKAMMAPLIQAPIFISFFFALKGMADLPLDSMKAGGLAWFTDLTTPDPLYALPVFTSVTLFATFMLGAEGSARLSNMKMSKYLIGALPFVMLPFTINFPSAVVCYWSTSNIFSLCQVAFIKIPAVRKYFDLPESIRHDPNSLVLSRKGFVEGVKDAVNSRKRRNRIQQLDRDSELAFKKAGIGPVVKTYSYDPTKVTPKVASTQVKK
ncbi:cytochrome oxidase biogenesis protein (oxa1 mitochondrial)-like [Tropilaelaps mercedesae]|uniref:Cytochrome oxidase biogenesis protein (Oxa1 mitochondrial)-like n=1 Tax=Tropilaelaps mercedesae TaxID=418985 RepID=A0A1V9WZE1_9ACAR|nr:cytochrome oxidase biogenesis protein (oxa1 mitochondrial)-like [Tropilaelaps mercedesae]